MNTTHRYQLSYTSMPHPWKRRHDAVTGALVPVSVEACYVRDTQTGDYASDPSTKGAMIHDLVREKNGLPAVSLPAIKRALTKAKLSLSETHATRIRGWHNWTPGLEISRSVDGTFALTYVSRRYGEDKTDVPALMRRAVDALAAAGIAASISLDRAGRASVEV